MFVTSVIIQTFGQSAANNRFRDWMDIGLRA